MINELVYLPSHMQVLDHINSHSCFQIIGDTYSSNIAMKGDGDICEIQLAPKVNNDTPMMYLDLETTGLGK